MVDLMYHPSTAWGAQVWARTWFLVEQGAFDFNQRCRRTVFRRRVGGLILDPQRRFKVIKARGRIPVSKRWSDKFLFVLHNLAAKWFLAVHIDCSTEFCR